MSRLAVALIAVALSAALTASCGGENNGVATPENNGSNNGGSNNGATNNGTPGTNNGATNNGTAGTNNGTSGTNNGTAAPNNGTVGTNNGTTVATNNGTTPGCSELDPAIGSCDPLCQTGCGADEHCVTTNTDPLDTECASDGAGTQGEACQDDSGCAPGYQCRSVGGGSARCLAYCSPAADDCPTNHTCTAYVGEPRLGVCISG